MSNKVVGLMLVRNEDWIIAASLQAACRWCDEMVVLLDRCTDRTADLVAAMQADRPNCITILPAPVSGEDNEFWNEMHMRQRMLQYAREIRGADVFALIDADEIPTANVIPGLRRMCADLVYGQVLELPMVPVWGDLDHYRHDSSVWSNSILSLAVRDTERKTLAYKPREDGYQHHARVPMGATGRLVPWFDKQKNNSGGVMHLQWANKRRLLWKHRWYKMIEVIRWPNRRRAQELNAIYGAALDEHGMRRADSPVEWWTGLLRDTITLNGPCYLEQECTRLLERHGPKMFAGLDLWGWPNEPH